MGVGTGILDSSGREIKKNVEAVNKRALDLLKLKSVQSVRERVLPIFQSIKVKDGEVDPEDIKIAVHNMKIEAVKALKELKCFTPDEVKEIAGRIVSTILQAYIDEHKKRQEKMTSAKLADENS